MIKIYLDACCLNRPFDDQSQPRVRLEAEAVALILEKLSQNKWRWVGSEILLYEIRQNPNLENKQRILGFTSFINQNIEVNEKLLARADELEDIGFDSYDALHLASAEIGKTDVFLTTDDKILKIASRRKVSFSFAIDNPVKWLEEVLR